jgi:hypothetical protein
MPSNAGDFGWLVGEGPRWFHAMLRNHLRPSSSWNSVGSKPDEFT